MILLFLLALVAFCLSAICGGGAGLLLMPMLGTILPISQVPAALSIGTASSSLSRIFVFYRNIRWDISKWFVPFAIPGAMAGAWCLKFLNPLYLEIAMGIFLISNLPALMRRKPDEQTQTQNSHSSLSIVGFLTGFVSGLTGAVGLIFNRFYLRHGLTKEEIVATRAANEIILHLVKIVLYISFGMMTSSVLIAGVIIAAAAIISSALAKRLVTILSEMAFRKIGYGAMVLAGLVMMFQGSNTLFAQNNGSIGFKPITGGIESKLHWQNANIAIEFEYDEGFEYEHEIPFSELMPDKQEFVKSKLGAATRIVIEQVHRIGKEKSYEAYFFNDAGFINKIDFE